MKPSQYTVVAEGERRKGESNREMNTLMWPYLKMHMLGGLNKGYGPAGMNACY